MAAKKKAAKKAAPRSKPKATGLQAIVTADSVTVTPLRGPVVPLRTGPRRG